MQITREAQALFDHGQTSEFSTCSMQFPNSVAHAGYADHIQTKSSDQEHQRNEPPPIHPCKAPMYLQHQQEREGGKEHHNRKGVAQGQEESSNGADPNQQPEPGRIIHHAKHEDQNGKQDKEQD